MRYAANLREPTAFRSWFYRIVINAAKRSAKLSSRSILVDQHAADRVDLTALSPEEAVIGLEEIEAVRKAITLLGEAHRETIVLKYYTNLTDEEIADALGVPAGTVKSRLHRAKEALEGQLTRSRLLPGSEGAVRAW